jgi:hypothetical protein
MVPTIDSKKQGKLVKSIGLNVFVLLLLAALILLYVIPTYEEISIKQNDLQTLNDEFLNIKNSGVSVAQYEALIAKYAGIKKTSALSPEDKILTESALKKDAAVEWDYLSWLETELSKKSTIDQEIEANNRIIGGVIPTYSEISGDKTDTFTQSQISLWDLSEFVERELLKKNSLESFSPVGFGWVSFDTKSNSLLTIGSYKLPLDIRGKNKNILSFIDSVQTSGAIAIKDGKLVEPTTPAAGSWVTNSRFNNLLVTFDSLTISNSLEDPEKDNTVSAVLVFYVRARSFNDLVAIRTKLSEGIKKLNSDIAATIALCADASKDECKNEGVIRAIQATKSLKNDGEELDKKIAERLKSAAVTDLGGEFSAIFDILTSYKSLSTRVLANTTQIEAIRKQFTK